MGGKVVITRERDIIHTATEGLIAPQDVDQIFAHLKEIVDLRRRLAGQVFVLADLRDGHVQPPETTQRIREWIARIHPPEDRVAFVVTSALLKSQVRRVGVNANQRFFDSSSAARLWLRAEAHATQIEAVR